MGYGNTVLRIAVIHLNHGVKMEKVIFESYHVYEDGRVYCLIRQKFLNFYLNKGYYECYVYENGVLTRVKVHRLVCQAFHKNPNNLPMVNHKDGNKINNHKDNVEWCDAYHNNKHARDVGLNNIADSNSKRWGDRLWAKRTAKKY